MSAPTIKAPYIIEYGNHKITVDPVIVSRVSGKFKSLYQENPEKLVITDTKYDLRVFMTFMTMAQRWAYSQPFYLMSDVKRMAEEWEAPLIVGKIVDKSQEINAEEAVKELKKAIKEKRSDEEIKELVSKVALVLPKALEEDDIEKLPMYVLYQIIDRAEADGYDSKNLIPFVFKVFEKNPDLAVPLVLRIDFDSLTEEQYSKLFCQPQIHEQNINFFAAAAMSSINQNANIQIKRFRKTFKETTANSGNAIEMGEINPDPKKQSTIVKDITAERTADLDRYRVQLTQQQETINDLVRALDTQQKALAQSIKRAHLAPSNEELLKTAQANLARVLEEGKITAVRLIEDDIHQEQEVLNEMLSEAKQKLDQRMDSLPPLPSDILESIQSYRTQFDAIESRLNEVQGELLDARSLMAAKIVRDKLRLDDFLRKTEDRFKLFEPGPECPMDIRPEDVEIAEKKVIGYEEQLEEKCPILSKPKKQ